MVKQTTPESAKDMPVVGTLDHVVMKGDRGSIFVFVLFMVYSRFGACGVPLKCSKGHDVSGLNPDFKQVQPKHPSLLSFLSFSGLVGMEVWWYLG